MEKALLRLRAHLFSTASFYTDEKDDVNGLSFVLDICFMSTILKLFFGHIRLAKSPAFKYSLHG
jgi:hypothetical protein